MANCSDKTIYSGKIINQEQLRDINFENREKLITKLGKPSYIDPIENKYFYFSEKSKKNQFLKEKLNIAMYLFSK